MFLGVCSSIYACPVGMINAGACLPPDDPRLPQNQGPAPPPAPIWADRWGAIASDGNGTYGIVTDLTSKRKASKAAIQTCKDRGGGNCVIRLTYYNQCAAVVMTDTWSAYASAPTLENAIEDGQKRCTGSNTGSCRVYWSGCSTAVRVN
ncbi:DUF4189 domain-containing protein [Acinetobacter sp.]|uniref:DUF4189 domain-containing protein n=1 Tax=Acinetobacter sp. TaxID=472 RepID=UPI0031E194EA